MKYVVGIKKLMQSDTEEKWKAAISSRLKQPDPKKYFDEFQIDQVANIQLIVIDPLNKSDNGKVIYYFPSNAFVIESDGIYYSFARYLHDNFPDYTIVFVRIPLAPTYCHEDFYEPFIK